MAAVFTDQTLASRAILKLLQDFDPDVKNLSDLKSGAILLKLLSELKLNIVKSSNVNKNPFQIMKKSLKKSPDKDILHQVNLEHCERGNEPELLCLSAILLHRLQMQKKENTGSIPNPGAGLSTQEVSALRNLWKRLDNQGGCFGTASKPSEVLKEFNYSPNQGSPLKQRTLETPGNWKKEMKRKDVCIGNLRSQMDDDQETISSLVEIRKSQDDKISKLEKIVRDQRLRISQYEETQKTSLDIDDLQTKIKSLNTENEKLVHAVNKLKETTREMPFVESENKELRAENCSLSDKASRLEERYQSLTKSLEESVQREWQSDCLSQQLAILKEEMQVKEETIEELNHMILVYQDRLNLERSECSAAVLDSSESEVVSLVCSPFRNTPNEITALHHEINSLYDEKQTLESSLKEMSAMLEKSSEANAKMEKEVDTLQNLVDHLNEQLQENKVQVDQMEASLESKESVVDLLTREIENLKMDRDRLEVDLKASETKLLQLQIDYRKSCVAEQELRVDVVGKNEAIRNLESIIEEKKTEQNELLNKINRLEDRENILIDRIEFGKCNVESLSVQIENLEGKMGALRSSNLDQATKMALLAKENDALQSRVSSLRMECVEITSKYELALEVKSSLFQSFEKLQQEHMLLQTSKSLLQDELEVSLCDSEKLVKEMAKSESECVNVLKDLKEMCLEKQKMGTNLEQLKLQNDASEKQCLLYEENIANLEFELAEGSKKYYTLEKKNEQCCELFKNVLKENQELNVDLNTCRDQVIAVRAKEMESQKTISTFEATFQSMNDRITAASDQLVFLNQQHSEDQSHLLDIRNDLEQKEAKKSVLNNIISTLQSQNDDLVNLNLSLEAKLLELQKDYFEMKIMIQSLNDQHVIILAQRDGDSDQILFLNAQHDVDKNDLLNVKNDLVQMESNNLVLNNLVSSLQSENEELVQLNGSLILENKDLNDNKMDLEIQLSCLITSNEHRTEKETSQHGNQLQLENCESKDCIEVQNDETSNQTPICDQCVTLKENLNYVKHERDLHLREQKDLIEDLQTQKYDVVNTVQTLKKEVNVRINEIAILEKENSILVEQNKTSLKSWEIEKSNLQNERDRAVETLEKELNVRQDEIVVLANENSKLSEQNKEALKSWEIEKSNLLNERDMELLVLSEKCITLESEIKNLQVKIEMYIYNEKEFSQQLDSMRSGVQEMEVEKGVIIAALCEEADSIEMLQLSCQEHKSTIQELTHLSENRAIMVDTLNCEIASMTAKVEQLTSELAKANLLVTALKNVKQEIGVLRVNNTKLEEEAKVVSKYFSKDIEHCYEEFQKLVMLIGVKCQYISELEDSVQTISESNDNLKADICERDSEISSLETEIKSTVAEVTALKLLLHSKEEKVIALEKTIQELFSSNDNLSKMDSERHREIDLLESELSGLNWEVSSVYQKLENKEKLLQEVSEARQSLAASEQTLRETVALQEAQINAQVVEIQKLSVALADQESLLKTKCDCKEGRTSLNDIHNPALKQWMDQFNSLCQKIQDMRQSHTKEMESRSPNDSFAAMVCNFENGVLTTIRDHIHSWFTSSEFLSEEEKAANELRKNNRSPKGIQEEMPCQACLAAAERIKILEQALEFKVQSIKILQEKHGAIFKKLESKERELSLTKDTLAICKQKLVDLKNLQVSVNAQHERELLGSKEETSSLRKQLDILKIKFSETEKKYLEEMQVVFKKFQEKMKTHNTTSKTLSQVKVQHLELSKQYQELIERYNWRKEENEVLSSKCKRYLAEIENQKTELRKLTLQKKSQELSQSSRVYGRRLSSLPDQSFMQESICSGDMSTDSVHFLKPSIPSRFVCDEEEGNFLDHSRNVSDLQEGRCEIISNSDRLNELRRRNTLIKPHLRCSYAAETQALADTSVVRVEDITSTPLKKNVVPLPPSSVSSVESCSSINRRQKQTQRELWQSPLEVSGPVPQRKQKESDDPSSAKRKQNWKKVLSSPFRSSTRKDKRKDPF